MDFLLEHTEDITNRDTKIMDIVMNMNDDADDYYLTNFT